MATREPGMGGRVNLQRLAVSSPLDAFPCPIPHPQAVVPSNAGGDDSGSKSLCIVNTLRVVGENLY